MNAERLLALYERVAEAPDAIPRLRNFVLDLAVRGKLTPQCPSEEPASSQLARIAEKRAALFAGSQKERRQLTQAVNEATLDLPAGWSTAKIGELARVLNGRAYKQTELLSEGTPVLRVGNLFTSNQWYFSNLTLDEDKYCDEGDLIYAWSASFGPFIWRGPKVIYHYHIWKLPLFSRSDLDQGFLYLSLLQKTREIKEAGRGISMIHMTKEKMEQITLALPPLAEQRRIVAKVDELMALLDRLEVAARQREATRDRLAAATLTCLTAPDTSAEEAADNARFALQTLPALTTRPNQIKALRQAILNLAVRGKLVEQIEVDGTARQALKKISASAAAEEPFTLPPSWAWVSVGSVGSTRLGKMLDKAKNRGTPRPYLRNLNVRWFDFDLSDLLEMPFEDSELEEFRLVAGDVLICEGGEPGRAAVWDERMKGVYFQKAIHRARFERLVDPRFFVLALKASADDGRLAESFTGTGIKHFTGKELNSYKFPLPPLAEQHRIVAKVEALMALCDQLEAALAEANTTRTRLLEALLHEALHPVATPAELETAE